MNHIQIVIPTSDISLQETLVALLSEVGFDGFEESNENLKAFADEDKFDEAALQEITSQFQLSYIKETIGKQNWNQLWESNFEPVIVDDFVGIRAHFHEPVKGVEHEIVITPKMSFGTGHHATTFSVMQLMRYIDFTQKTVFDFGTGTGILAILAEKLGATEILALDNDDWCIENATENAENNHCLHTIIKLADTAQVEQLFDIVIANINKNIILDNIESLSQAVRTGGQTILSGLLVEDEADILLATGQIGWQHVRTINKGAWIAMAFNA